MLKNSQTYVENLARFRIKALKTSEFSQETIYGKVSYLKFWTAVDNFNKKETRYRDFTRTFSEISGNSNSIK